ncbi:MAG: glycine cleavage system aminomethyltransferase GcvT [Nitrospirae bacterium]|nr:glycine cleavage system aminomethyltransferase GcvT [Nitrospirota bacterium]
MRTPLYEEHVALGAKITVFYGWEMPLQYTRVAEEHLAVRRAAGLFDVSHMGEILFTGPRAASFLERMTTNWVEALGVGQAQYTLLCREDGGILDDTVLYRPDRETFLLCVNAANTEKIFRWCLKHRAGDEEVRDATPETALLALQGPRSTAVLESATSMTWEGLKLHQVRKAPCFGVEVLVARTGYTGERGYEIFLPTAAAVSAWRGLLAAGAPYGLKPVGLGARDALRLEMGYPLYGHELSEEITPLEAGLEQFLDLHKAFIGRDAILQLQQQGIPRKIAGFEMIHQGVPREGYAVYSLGSPPPPDSSPIQSREGGTRIGRVTSGGMSPSLKKGIGMALVEAAFARPETEIWIDIRGKMHRAKIVERPFYKKAVSRQQSAVS